MAKRFHGSNGKRVLIYRGKYTSDPKVEIEILEPSSKSLGFEKYSRRTHGWEILQSHLLAALTGY